MIHAIASTITIAGLTVKEALRRRFALAAIVIALLYGALAYLPIHGRHHMFLDPASMAQLTDALLVTRGASTIDFFGFVFSVAIAAGLISTELEKGVLAVIAPKPISRGVIFTGKWLGAVLFVVPCMALWCALLQTAIVAHVHHEDPSLWQAFPAMCLYPVTFVSLTMLFSAVASSILSTVMPLILASVAWSYTILKTLGYLFDIESLKLAARIVAVCAPLNPMSRWVEHWIHPEILTRFSMMSPRFGPAEPAASTWDLVWIAAYSAIAFGAGLAMFQRRDIS